MTQTIKERLESLKATEVQTSLGDLHYSPEEHASFNAGVDACLPLLKEVRKEGAEEYKQFILNILDGVDIADGECNTKAIRFTINSRII